MYTLFTPIISYISPLVTNFTHFGASRSTITTCDPNATFFGLPVWYKYLFAKKGVCRFENLQVWPPDNLLLIGVAVLDMLLRLAGMVAVGFIIWGGVTYVISQGEPDKVKEAQQTIINALIGLFMTLVAVALVSFMGARLRG